MQTDLALYSVSPALFVGPIEKKFLGIIMSIAQMVRVAPHSL